MASGEHGEIIQYVPFASFVHPSFWHTLTEMKLEVDKLDESTKQICGKFSYRDDVGSVFEVDGTSFNKSPNNIKFYENVTGTLMNKNTIEDFKTIDKAGLLNSIGEEIWAKVKSKSWVTNPSLLLNFVMLSYADLKKFHYYYWFAFPCPSQPTLCLKESKHITTVFNYNHINALTQGWRELKRSQKPFFAFRFHDDNLTMMTLEECFETGYIDPPTTYFVFEDPSTEKNPGWPLRLFLAALLDHFPSIVNSELNVLGLRCNMHGIANSSQIFTIKIPANVQTSETAGWVGWERNDKGNFGPKLANMSASMDPVKLADTSPDLNIKLMKWRLVPDIDVDVMKRTSCLLLGAGTLGCHVARNLLAWGFRHMTLVDSGKVSHSNPTRQVLFNYQDCLAGGKMKAAAAADNLRMILPTVDAKGIVAHIPMPGHPVGDSMKEETLANIKTITQAIVDHDVIFLLLDTREARWLPALLAACHGKIVINAALGFDSYLVMRHGVTSSVATATPLEGASIQAAVSGGQLGCYFCNDVTAPGNSLKDRTLDQQCTVTRPGVAAIAGALAVEFLVGLLQHPLRAEAPAICKPTDDSPQDTQGVLGSIPHSIRGFLHSYQTVLPTCTKFKQCIACSNTVINKYREEGIEFLLKVFNSGTYLEEVTGLAELQLSAEMTDIVTLSDEDEDTS